MNRPWELIRCEQRVEDKGVSGNSCLEEKRYQHQTCELEGDAALNKEHKFGLSCSERRTVKWKYLTGSLVPSWKKKVEMTKVEIEA